MDTLAVIVTAADRPTSLEFLLQDTAERHIKYGATEEHYRIVGDALLWMMQQQLGNDFTPAVKEAWTELYQIIATTMQRLGKKVRK